MVLSKSVSRAKPGKIFFSVPVNKEILLLEKLKVSVDLFKSVWTALCRNSHETLATMYANGNSKVLRSSHLENILFD